jgi:hypothetical protein
MRPCCAGEKSVRHREGNVEVESPSDLELNNSL